jgi:hypothetical protein
MPNYNTYTRYDYSQVASTLISTIYHILSKYSRDNYIRLKTLVYLWFLEQVLY